MTSDEAPAPSSPGTPLPDDLRVFMAVVRKSSFAKAAEDLGQSAAYVSKRIRVLESALGARLLHRTTRRVAMTDVGERTHVAATRVLADLDELVAEASSARHIPRGQLLISSSFGFGRAYVSPAISALSDRYPELQIRLDILDRQVDLVAEGFDLDIHQATVPPAQHIARKLASNHRILTASPAYLAEAGVPRTLADLASHQCLVIKVREHPFGVWTLRRGRTSETVRVNGSLSSNSGEVVTQWALDGRGIMFRSIFGTRSLIDSGRLVRVLPQWHHESHVWAVYPTRLSSSAKLRVCVEFFADYFSTRLPAA